MLGAATRLGRIARGDARRANERCIQALAERDRARQGFRALLDHLDECPMCACSRITFGVPAEGVCECECHDSQGDSDGE